MSETRINQEISEDGKTHPEKNLTSNSQTLASLKKDLTDQERQAKGITPIDQAEEAVIAEFETLEPFQQQMLKNRLNQKY